MTKRKISYEQDLALVYGRNIARQNQKRQVAARQAADEAHAAHLEAEAKRQADELALRYGFELGELVTGRDRTWRKPRTGTVIDGPRSEAGAGGVFVEDSDGNQWELGRYTVKRIEKV